jgi:ApaG protein
MRYEKATEGIRVTVEPRFALSRSDPAEGTFVFAYEVELANEGEVAAQLLFRHWLIHDSSGEDSELDGEGVVGEQPRIDPGGSHRYESFCVLSTPSGYMEGYYTFQRTGGARFRVEIPRFHFAGPVVLPTDESGDEVLH